MIRNNSQNNHPGIDLYLLAIGDVEASNLAPDIQLKEKKILHLSVEFSGELLKNLSCLTLLRFLL